MSTAECPLPNAPEAPISASGVARVAFIGVALVPAFLTAWVLWLAPIADLAADRTAIASRDFAALWGAGRLAAEGATAILSDPALFSQHLRDWFGPGMPNQIWPYPPPVLLLAAPLARLPLASSLLLYTAATLLLLWHVLRAARLPRPLCLAVLLSPAIADNVLIGQNGALTAALLAGGLLLIDVRPIAAGALLGALILKPQMGLLIPICLVAGGRWRVGMVAAVVAASIAGLSCLCFGAGAWLDYLVIARPAITAYFEAPWDPASGQRIFASAFIAVRSLGASLTTAYAVQAIVTLSCAVLVARVWRRPDATPWPRAALTIALTCVASPWVHSYDMPALAVGIVMLAQRTRLERHPLLALAWFWPGALTVIPIPNALLVVSSASIAWLAWRADRPTTASRSWRVLGCTSSAS